MAFVKAQIEVKPASVGTGIKVSLRAGRGAHARMAIFFGFASRELPASMTS